MKATATVKMFLALGEPDSVRTAEISNWTGKAVAGPRSQLELILRRDEAANPGVYFLTGVNPETGKPRVYIGEAEVIRSRIEQLLPVLGQDILKTVARPSGPREEAGLLTYTIKGLGARGRVTENGFLVLSGSEAVLEERPSSVRYPYASNLRSQLLVDGVLVEWEKNSARDSEFDLIYVNGGNNLENLRLPDETWKVRLIEEDFQRLMFEMEGA